jgi:hypothetical protein
MATNERKKAYDAEYTKKYLKQYILRISRKTSQNVIDWLSSKENVNDYIKSLVEEDMIRNGINPKEEKTMKSISINNGASFCEPAEAIENMSWDTITSFMDPDIMEQVASEIAPCTNEIFLNRYLELANDDLIIG